MSVHMNIDQASLTCLVVVNNINTTSVKKLSLLIDTRINAAVLDWYSKESVLDMMVLLFFKVFSGFKRN